MSNPQPRGRTLNRAPRAFRLALFSILISGGGAVALLGGNLALLAFEPTPTAKVPAEVKPRAEVNSTVAAESHRPKGSLLICGGATPGPALDRLFELAGGRKARIVLIPSASPRYAESEQIKAELETWRARGVASVQMLHTRSREVANDPAFVHPLTEATGVWLGGGNQSSLIEPYRGTEVERQMKALLERGGVIGGTSAGASVMSQVMIAGGREKADVGEGFGFLTDVVIDQHFLRRNRIGRLLGVLSSHPNLIGIGIDEKTALEVDLNNNQLKVLGSSYVVACVPDEAKKSVRLNILAEGDELDLGSLKVLPTTPQPIWSPLRRNTYVTLGPF